MVTTAGEITTKSVITNFDAVVGASKSLDGCTIEAGATDVTIFRASEGLTICRTAANYEYATGCSVAAGNNTIVCSGDPVTAANIANCQVVGTVHTNRGISECNP